MTSYRSDGGGMGWATVLGIGLLSAALAMAVVAYSGRLVRGPDPGRPIACEDPGCKSCLILDAERVERDRDFRGHLEEAGWVE